MTTGFVYEDILSQHILREDHVMAPKRLQLTYELLKAYGAFDEPYSKCIKTRQASIEELGLFHSTEYIKAVQSISDGKNTEDGNKYNFSEHGDNPPYAGMFEASKWSTGSSLVAFEALDSGVAKTTFNISGGLHHAMPNHASGFCIFNDPVIAIKSMLANGYRVAYIDIDAHHGDGVQHAFYDTDDVLTISIHESGQFIFPGTGFTDEIGAGKGIGYSVNVPLYPNTDDEIYQLTFTSIVPPIINSFKPDILVSQLGIDTHFLDPITHMKITTQGFAEVVRQIKHLAPTKWLALGGGGYDIAAVARAWTLAYGVMLGEKWDNQIPNEYSKKYGIDFLADENPPNVDSGTKSKALDFAKKTIDEIHQKVFRVHSLSF